MILSLKQKRNRKSYKYLYLTTYQQRVLQMINCLSDYLNFSNEYDDQIDDVLSLLSSQHSIFKNNDIIQEILEHPNVSATHNDLLNIHKDVSSYITKIAPKSLNIAAERNVLTLSEMIALQSCLSLLNTLINAKTQFTIEKLASIITTKNLAR